MSRIHLAIWRGLAMGALLSTVAQPAFAQTPDSAGVVRITDISHEQVAPIPEGAGPAYGTPGCPNCPGGSGPAGGHYGIGVDPNFGAGYGAGYGCPDGCYYPSKNVRLSHSFRKIMAYLHPCGSCSVSPGTGWAPPIKRPIYRTPVVYQKAFADHWTGAPRGPQVRVPHVYMPTDTTQLGFYYQHVPYWLPRGAAIPPAPIPEQYHVGLCEADLYGKHPAGVVLGTAPEQINAPLYDGDGLPYGPDDVSTTESGESETQIAAEPARLPVQ